MKRNSAPSTETANEYPATRVVHWPSGPVDACEKHARQLVGLANMLGSHVGVGVALPGAQCSNCINEAAKDVPDGGIGVARSGLDV